MSAECGAEPIVRTENIMRRYPGFFPLRALFALLALSLSPLAAASELYLSVFLQANPLKGVDVELNDRFVGVTGGRGDVATDLYAGRHVVRLVKNGAAITEYAFAVKEGENAEISIRFTDFETKPDVAADVYLPGAATAASGELSGVIAGADGTPIAGAKVSIAPGDTLATTDSSGVYSVTLPRGEYRLTVAHPDFEDVSSGAIRVIANVGVAANIKLAPKQAVAVDVPAADAPAAAAPVAAPPSGVEEVVALGSYKPLESTVETERFSLAVTDAISIDELLRIGDSDVAASLRRIVGVSVTGGRYAVVRGLDGRYISATLNGNLMPSTDPFRRDVQLDLFPNDILGGIEIQKTFTADMPGDTTGGIIKIKTRDLPENYVNSLSASLGYVTGTTGDDLLTYEGSGSDALGFDDGLRELPGAIDAATNGGLDFSVCQFDGQPNCVEREQAAQLAALLPNIYNVRRESAGPDFGLGYTLGNVFDREIGTVGVYGSVSYDTGAKSRQDAVINIPNVRNSSYGRDEFETTLNGYLVAGIENDSWKVLSKTMVLRSTEDTTEVEVGVDPANDQLFEEYLLEWVERQFIGQQFEGEWTAFDDDELSWRAGLSQTRRDAPDRRSYEYQASIVDGQAGTPAAIVPTIERSYAELTEDGVDLGVDYLMPFEFSDSVFVDVQVGALFNRRERESELVRLGFRGGNNADRTVDLESLLTPENFANGTFTLAATSTDTDAYEADQESLAYYISTTTTIADVLTVIAGVRQDEFTQTIEFPNASVDPVEIESNEALPSLGLIYQLGSSWQLRAGYGKTVSRPNITENAPTRFFDERGRQFIGCTAAEAPACTPSLIDNYDLRAEYYFNDDRDSISLALFWKDISDPIERAVPFISGQAQDSLTFRNQESATIGGIELDASVTALDMANHALTIAANIAFIESEINLDAQGRQLELDPNRELQGQSPFLANLQFAYDHFPSAQKLTLLANYFDDRIDIVAGRPDTPIYEVGRATVNFNYEKEFANASKISFKAKNLLDEQIQYEQNGRIIESYSEGTEFSVGYTYKF
jgi:outer membrane receptor protein involved in Fe transport